MHSAPSSTISVLTMVASIVFVTGCAAPPPVVVADNTPGVRLSIKQAIARADVQKAAMSDAAVPASLAGNTMTVIWEGDAAEILQRIAAAQRLEFKSTGPIPRLQLPVFVKLRQASLAEALAAIGEQCGGRADVVLTESTIELRSKLY